MSSECIDDGFLEGLVTDLQIENKELKEQILEVRSELGKWEKKFKSYTKEEAQLLFKVQKVKQKLHNMHIQKSGKNNFQHYTYYELEDINKPITDALIEEGLASAFLFKENAGFLQIIDGTTGAYIQWCTLIQTSPRWQKTLEDCSKKGDVGDVMKAQQALQTYARRTLYLQALEINEPNTIERSPGKEKSTEVNDGGFHVPENIDHNIKQIFDGIKKDFGTKVPFTKQAITNKLKSMKTNHKIDENMYTNCLEILEE